MKLIFTLVISIILFSGCQKELSVETPTNPPPPTSVTDTSVILIRKDIYHFTSNGDSSFQIYKNNKINGVKGYIIIDSAPGNNYHQTSTFKYDNNGHLVEISSINNSPTNPQTIIKKITWEDSRIKRIYWTEDGVVRMDRYFDYDFSHDSLYIKYSIATKASFILDSVGVIIIADTAQNKIRALFESGVFDFNINAGTEVKQVHYSESDFQYSGNNMSSVKYYGETFDNSIPAPAFSNEIDSSVCYFTRNPQVSGFMNNLEKEFLGKELRILAYNQADSIGWWFEDFFNYGGSFNVISPSRYYAIDNIFTASYSPLINSTINYIVRRDGVIADQKTNYLYQKKEYTLDADNRIKSIKEYDATNNSLATEIYFYYQ